MYQIISTHTVNFINKYYKKKYILKINNNSIFISQLYFMYQIFYYNKSKFKYLFYLNLFNICNNLYDKIQFDHKKISKDIYYILNNSLFIYLLFFKHILNENNYFIGLLNILIIFLILIRNAYNERLNNINNNISSYSIPSIYKLVILTSDMDLINNIVYYLRYFTTNNYFIFLSLLKIFYLQ